MKKKNNEFYIYMKNTPVYDASKPYFEQTKEVLEFYTEEERKMKEGVTIDGVFIHPWLYCHLNYFKTPIPVNGEEKIINPPLDDNVWYLIETFKKCEELDLGAFIMGCRGFSKSSCIASNMQWIATTKENGTSEIIGGEESDLNAISRLMDIGFNNIHPAFRLPRNLSNWSKHIEFGMKNKRKERIRYSDIFIKNANKGTEKSSEKGAGGSPVSFFLDEAGKFDFLGLYQAALPAFDTPTGRKLVPILSATGGNNKLSKDARKVCKNPEAYEIFSGCWDILNSMCPEPHRTWNDKEKFVMFAPGQMSYRLPVPKIKSNLAEFLGVNSKQLAKIPIMVTDWEKATQHILNKREVLRKDEDALNKFKMYFPITSRECFLENTKNPFPVNVAKRHLQELLDLGKTGSPVELYKDSKGWARKDFSDKKIAQYPFLDNIVDSPFVVYGNHSFPDKEKPPRHLYIGGFDGYKQNVAENSDSLGSCYILQRRNTGLNTPCERIVCSYTSRPDQIRNFHNNSENMLEIYNAECCMESADQHFLQHLDAKGKAFDILSPSISFGQLNSKKKSSGNTKFGIYPTKANKDYMMNLFIDYCKQAHEIDMDEDGNKTVKLGVEFIDDPWLLEEIIQYRPGKNVDRIIAFCHALAWARELDKKEILPDFTNSINIGSKKEFKRKRVSISTSIGGRRFNPYK